MDGTSGSGKEGNGSDNSVNQNKPLEQQENTVTSTVDGGHVGNNGDVKTASCTKVAEAQSANNHPVKAGVPEEITTENSNESNNDTGHAEKPSCSSSTPNVDDLSASILKRLEHNDSEEDMSITEETAEPSEVDLGPEVELRVIFNKNPMPIKISLKKTVGDLKRIVEKSTNVTAALMKVLVKGNAKDEVTLESLGLNNGSKVLIIGTALADVMKVAQKPTEKELQEDTEGASSNEPKSWCSVPRHQKVIDKGIPDDVMPGISNCNDELPPFPISGMVGAKGSKVRLTFKLESDELWIGTKERTEKVPIGSIKAVISQPITGFEHYHIMAIQLGPTEASRFYIYWVPAQYVRAIKTALSP